MLLLNVLVTTMNLKALWDKLRSQNTGLKVLLDSTFFLAALDWKVLSAASTFLAAYFGLAEAFAPALSATR